MSEHLEVHALKIAVGDIVRQGGELGEVMACAAEGLSLFCIIGQMELVEEVSSTSSRWRRAVGLLVWPAESVLSVQAWLVEESSVLVIVR